MLSGLFGLNGSVDREEIGLIGYLGHRHDHQIDSVGALPDLGQFVAKQRGASGQLLHGGIHANKVGTPLLRALPGLGGHLIDLGHGAQQFLTGGGDFMDRSASIGRGGSVILDDLLLLCPGRLHHCGSGVKRGCRHLDAPNQGTEVSGHGLDGAKKRPGLIIRDRPHLCP